MDQSNFLSNQDNFLFGKSSNNMKSNDISSITENPIDPSFVEDSLLLSKDDFTPKPSSFETPSRLSTRTNNTDMTFNNKAIDTVLLKNKELVDQVLQLKPDISKGMNDKYYVEKTKKKSKYYDMNDITIKKVSNKRALDRNELLKIYESLSKRNTYRSRRKQRSSSDSEYGVTAY